MPDISFPSDPPNNPSLPLAQGPLEPLQFTTVRPLVFLLVDVGEGEECAYRDGAFRGRYAGVSSYADNSGVLFRQGGWPQPPKVVAKVEPAPTPLPAGGLKLGAIYEVDLTAQPTQDLSDAGSYTIDGKTWWAKGPRGTGVINGVVNGQGLRLYHPAAPSYPTAYANWRGANSYGARLLAFQISQLPSYNPLAPVAIQWRFASPFAMSQRDDCCVYGGIADVVESAAALGIPEKSTALSLAIIGTSGAYFTRDNNNNSLNVTPAGGPPYSLTYGNNSMGMYRFLRSRWFPLIGASYSGGFPDPDDNIVPNTPSYNIVAPNYCADPSFIFLLEKNFADGGALDIYLTHLRVLQPKVAA